MRANMKDKRHYIRLMSKASAVPVEPQEQTNLLEESILAPGVIGGTVPGGKSSPSRRATSLPSINHSLLSCMFGNEE
jgi:phosphomevalonate kinase